MATAFIQKPAPLSLLGNLPDIKISTDDDVAVTLSSGGEEILSQRYTPGQDGVVTIDIKDVLTPQLSFTLTDSSIPYRQESIVKTFSLTAGTASCEFTVLRAGVDHLSDSAENFLRRNFLTWQPNIKPVTYNTPEFLSYYAIDAAVIKCQAYIPQENGDPVEANILTLANIPAGEAWTIPVQYAIIAGKLGNTLPSYYDIWAETTAGSRLTYIQRYYASDMHSEQEQWILFENSLGGVDTFRAYGNENHHAQHTHNLVEIDETSKEYRVDTTREFQKNSGHLNRKERLWLQDFFPSLGKYIYIDNYLRRIVMTESDVSFTAKELPSQFTFTFRFADAKPYLNLPRTDRPSRILDIQIPDVGSFTLAPRLAELDRLPLSAGALFPVQSPYAETWCVTTAAAIVDYVIETLAESYHGDGSVGHSHSNIALLNSLSRRDRYLLIDAVKIYAGRADEAYTLTEDSPVWGCFLRKDQDDETQHKLTMVSALVKENATIEGSTVMKGDNRSEGNLTFGSSDSSDEKHYEQGIKGCRIYWNGSGWHVETDYLSVNKRMYAKSIQVDEVTHVGGENLLTEASCVADSVKEYSTFYRVFFRRKNGEGRTIFNQFRVGDQAYCQIFNIDAGESEGFTNRYYWRLVVNTSNNTSASYDEETVTLMENFHFIDLSKSISDVSGDLRMDDHAGSVPKAEDPIVQLGYRRQAGDDDELVAERQGATLISGGGKYKRAIVMWEGINSFVLPNPRIFFSPNRVDMVVDSLKIRTAGTEKPVEQYVDDNQEQFEIFETGTNDIPTLNNEPYISWSAADKEKYSTSPNNAVILNSEGRTWRFVKSGSTYAFEEFTDPWLLAQHVKVENILADDVISADEIPSMQLKANTIAALSNKVQQEYSGITSPPASMTTIYNNYIAACAVLLSSSGTTGYFYDFSQITPPIYLRKGNEPNRYRASREDVLQAICNHDILLDQWNKAYTDYKTAVAASAALSSAKDYVDRAIENIDASTIDAQLGNLINAYKNNSLATHSQLEAVDGKVTVLTNWVGTDAQSFGSTGLMTHLSSLFVGTGAVTLVKDANKNVIYYDDDDHQLYKDANGVYYIVNSQKIYKPYSTGKEPKDYGSPKVYNISKAGLVTDTQFAALSTRVTNAEGQIVSAATIATWITDSFDSDANATKLKSHILITADDVKIESGSKSMGDYFSLMNGNLWCQNLTVEGVYNNLIDVIDWADGIGKDKIIVAYFSGTDGDGDVLAYSNSLGSIVDADSGEIVEPAALTYGSIRCYLDVMNCGDVLVIKSLPSVLQLNSDDQDGMLRLPFFIDSGIQERTYTRFNDSGIHLITPDELRMIVGKKMTIRTTINDTLYQQTFLKGQYHLTALDASARAIQTLVNGLPFYLDRPIGNNGEIRPDLVMADQRLNGPKTLFLEMKLCEFFSDTSITQASRKYGYAWCGQESYAGSALGEDIDVAWNN